MMETAEHSMLADYEADLCAMGRTPPGTEHYPTHKRTLSGRLVPLDAEPYLGWVELLVDYTLRLKEYEEENPPEVNKRLGEFYAETRAIPHPVMLREWVCSLCTLPMSAPKCEHPNGVDKWDEHKVAYYGGRPNRAMRRAHGQSSRHAKVLSVQLGAAWGERHSKKREEAA